jgi:hypothetical protein
VYGVDREVHEGEMAADAAPLAAPTAIQMEAFGAYKLGGYICIDISYPNLLRYARSIANDGLLTLINRIENATPTDLVGIAMEDFFEVGEGIDATQLKDILLQIVANKTGEQRIKSLLVTKLLIDNDLGCIGASYFRGKRLRVRLTREYEKDGDAYTPELHEVGFGRVNASELILCGDRTSLVQEEVSSLFHELTHVYHAMLGINLTVAVNSTNAAIMSDPNIRRYLCPLLDPVIFTKVQELIGIDDVVKSNLDNNLDFSKALEDEKTNATRVLEFLKDNSLIAVPPDGTNNVWKATTYIATRMTVGWSNGEEALTIYGLAPFIIWHGQTGSGPESYRFLYIDRQNECTYRIRNSNKYRMLHVGLKRLARLFDPQKGADQRMIYANRIAQIIHQTIGIHGVLPYLAQAEMTETDSNVHRKQTAGYAKVDVLTESLVNGWYNSTPNLHDASELEAYNLADLMYFVAKKGEEITENDIGFVARSGKLLAKTLKAYYICRKSAREEPKTLMEWCMGNCPSQYRHKIANAFLEYFGNRDTVSTAIENGCLEEATKWCAENDKAWIKTKRLINAVWQKINSTDYAELQHAFEYAGKFLALPGLVIPDRTLQEMVDKMIKNGKESLVTVILRYASRIGAQIDCTNTVRKVGLKNVGYLSWAFVEGRAYVDINDMISDITNADNGNMLYQFFNDIVRHNVDESGRIRVDAVYQAIKNRRWECVYRTFPTNGVQYDEMTLQEVCKKAAADNHVYTFAEVLKHTDDSNLAKQICEWFSLNIDDKYKAETAMKALDEARLVSVRQRRVHIVQQYVKDSKIGAIYGSFPAEGIYYGPDILGKLLKYEDGCGGKTKTIIEYARDKSIVIEPAIVQEVSGLLEKKKIEYCGTYRKEIEDAHASCKAYLNRVGHKRPVAAP